LDLLFFITKILSEDVLCVLVNISQILSENSLCTLFDISHLFPIVWLLSPRVIYMDALTDREDILTQNKGRSGVYCWTNKLNGKKYIGSSKDLGDKTHGRLNRYYRKSNLSDSKRGISHIYRALNKHGHSNFMVSILEYCPIERLAEREQFYMDILKPEYNILKLAYTSQGYSHTAESLELMRGARPHYSPSKEQRLSISQANRGKILSRETRALISKSMSKPIYMYSLNPFKLVSIYTGVVAMKKELKANPTLIKQCCETGKLFRGYRLSYKPLLSK